MASVVCLVALFEQDGFGVASRRRKWERFYAGCAAGVEEELADAACGAGVVLVGGVAREREDNERKMK